MAIFALADLHLALSTPQKSMELFSRWKDYINRIETHWRSLVSSSDLVLIPGDISWALKPQEALPDLKWLDSLPGTKLLIRGNHDYWWPSNAKLKSLLPPSIAFIHNTAFTWKGIAFGGARLWDTSEYQFEQFIEFEENPQKKAPLHEKAVLDAALFERELGRLSLSLEQLAPEAKMRIALTHYPPIGAELAPSKAASLLEQFGIKICVFGHLHNVKKEALPFGEARGVRYILTSADYLDFSPLLILP